MKLPMRDVANASRQVATKSAMNPILWLSAVVTPVALVLGYLAPTPFGYFVFALGSIPILVGCGAFVYFAGRDPNRLQSESHIEHMEMLSRIGDNARGSERTIAGSSEAITGNIITDQRPGEGQ